MKNLREVHSKEVSKLREDANKMRLIVEEGVMKRHALELDMRRFQTGLEEQIPDLLQSVSEDQDLLIQLSKAFPH